jgi:hypothetical protein
MRSIQVIVDQREPGQVQVFATGVDASVASLGGTSHATLWLPTDLARSLRRDLVERLDDTPPVQLVPLNSALVREPTCWPWCGGVSEPHSPDLCYRDHSIVALSLEPALRGETGTEPATVELDIEVADRVPVVGVAVGEDATQHRTLTVAEARQLAASLVDAADVAAADTVPGTAGGAS